MKKRNKNKNGWPRGSQNERTPRAAVPPKNVVADSDKETSAASTDEDDSDDGDGDGTPAASTAGKKSRPNKRTEAFPAVDQGETGDKETQLLEEAQEESREEVKDKLVMGAHGQPAKQEFKATKFAWARGRGILVRSHAENPGQNRKFVIYIDGGVPHKCFNKMFGTLPFPSEGFRGLATLAMGESLIRDLKSRSVPFDGEKAGVPGRDYPASEVFNQTDRTPSGLQECVGSGDRARSRARRRHGGKDEQRGDVEVSPYLEA